jgi:FkbM family methyltransferase
MFTPAHTVASLAERLETVRTVFFLAGQSFLGSIFLPRTTASFAAKYPQAELVMVTMGETSVPPGFSRVITHRDFLSHTYSDAIGINCAAAPSTWLAVTHECTSTQCVSCDLTELMFLLDVPLVYEHGRDMQRKSHDARDGFRELRERFADDFSRQVLDAVLAFRATANRGQLLEVLSPPEEEYFSFYRSTGHPIPVGREEHYVDVGAYDGDTVHKFLGACRGNYSSIHAFEPDPVNFERLRSRYSDVQPAVRLHQCVVSDQSGPMRFNADATMGSRVSGTGSHDVAAVRLDDAVPEVSILKMDVEGHEPHVIRGASNLIARCRPRMAITCYHHALDLLSIVAEIDRILPDSELRLRHYSLFTYDTILYVC